MVNRSRINTSRFQMKRSCHLLVILILLVSISCKSSKPSATQAEIDNLTEIITNKRYRIESAWAYPQITTAMQQIMSSGLMLPGNSVGAISLIGNSNFLEIKGDSISSYLPYFGERQMQVGYGINDNAIQFEGLVENYKVNKFKNTGYEVSFEATSKSEKFNVRITIFPNLKTTIGLSGGLRRQISYTGDVTRP